MPETVPLPNGLIGRFYVTIYGRVVLEVEGANGSSALIGSSVSFRT